MIFSLDDVMVHCCQQFKQRMLHNVATVIQRATGNSSTAAAAVAELHTAAAVLLHALSAGSTLLVVLQG